MKKVGKYVVITLLLLLGLCCVGVLYLFFIPNSTLFNISYLSKAKTIQTEKVTEYVSSVTVNSRAYDVRIETTSEDEIYLKLVSKSFGFVLNKNKTADVKATIKNGSLTYDVTEPHGFIARNRSYIVLYIPEDSNLNLKLFNKKAKTTIKDEAVKINNLTYSTQSGDVFFEKGTIVGSLNLNLGNAEFYMGEKVKTFSNNIDLEINKGAFYAPESKLGNIEILSNNRGVVEINECLDLIHNTSKTSGGRIEIAKLELATVSTSDTNLIFGEICAGAVINLTQSGKVTIDTVSINLVDITTNSGNIKIGESSAKLILTSDSGNITVGAATKEVSIHSNYGDAEIDFHKDTPHFDNSNNYYRTLYADIKNGKLTATGVENIGSGIDKGINVSGNARVYLTMTDVVGQNMLLGGNGNVSVVINHSSIYRLTTQSDSGNVRVNLAQIADSNGYTTKDTRVTLVNTVNSSTPNSLNISTKAGDLKVLDTLMNTL